MRELDIPTPYPNGLPGGIPAEAFDQVDAERALELARHVLQFVEGRFPSRGEATSDDAEGEKHG
jgi:HEPN domain-containing protein